MIEERRNEQGLTEAEFLAAYRPKEYPHPALTADIILLSGEEEKSVLLIKRKNHPCIEQYALPGGFVEPNENTRTAAMRELGEETGIEGQPLCSVGTFTDPERDPRDWIVTEAFLAKVDRSTVIAKAGDDAKEADWFSLDFSLKNNMLTLALSKKSCRLNAKLKVDKVENGFDCQYILTVLENDGLAFDHAKIIGTAVLKYLICERA